MYPSEHRVGVYMSIADVSLFGLFDGTKPRRERFVDSLPLQLGYAITIANAVKSKPLQSEPIKGYTTTNKLEGRSLVPDLGQSPPEQGVQLIHYDAGRYSPLPFF